MPRVDQERAFEQDEASGVVRVFLGEFVAGLGERRPGARGLLSLEVRAELAGLL